MAITNWQSSGSAYRGCVAPTDSSTFGHVNANNSKSAEKKIKSKINKWINNIHIFAEHFCIKPILKMDWSVNSQMVYISIFMCEKLAPKIKAGWLFSMSLFVRVVIWMTIVNRIVSIKVDFEANNREKKSHLKMDWASSGFLKKMLYFSCEFFYCIFSDFLIFTRLLDLSTDFLQMYFWSQNILRIVTVMNLTAVQKTLKTFSDCKCTCRHFFILQRAQNCEKNQSFFVVF